MLKIYQLPDDLVEGPLPSADEVIIRHYNSNESSVKNRIMLKCNMINLLVSGSKTVVYPHATTVIHEGELVILSSGNMLTSELIKHQQPFSSVLLYFSNEVLHRFLARQTQSAQPAAKQFVTYKQDEFIRHYIQSLLLLLKTPALFTADLRQLKLEELLTYLLHVNAVKLRSLRTIAEAPEDYAIRKTVESHIGETVTVEELAFLCNMSRATFQRKFERIYNTSPQKYLRSKKLEMAAELLATNAEQPSAVYFKVGYQNHASFSAAFREQFGLTPSEYQSHYMSATR